MSIHEVVDEKDGVKKNCLVMKGAPERIQERFFAVADAYTRILKSHLSYSAEPKTNHSGN